MRKTMDKMLSGGPDIERAFTERLPFLGDGERYALREFVRRLGEAEGENLLRVILYGSMARGDHEEDSDADLLVLLRQGDWNEKREAALDIAMDVEDKGFEVIGRYALLAPFVETEAGLRAEREGVPYWELAPVFEAIREEGVPLFAQGASIMDEPLRIPQEKRRGVLMRLSLKRADEDMDCARDHIALCRHPEEVVRVACDSVYYSIEALFNRRGLRVTKKTVIRRLRELVQQGLFPPELEREFQRLKGARDLAEYGPLLFLDEGKPGGWSTPLREGEELPWKFTWDQAAALLAEAEAFHRTVRACIE